MTLAHQFEHVQYGANYIYIYYSNFLYKIINKRNKRKVIEIDCNRQLTKIYQSDIVLLKQIIYTVAVD